MHIKAVATYAPLWFSQRAWATIRQAASPFPIHDQGGPNAVSVWYRYTHAEIL